MKKIVAAASSLWAVHLFAHPGHSSGDVVAEVANPLAGPDHIVAFLAAAVLVAITVRALARCVRARRDTRPQP
jgi:hydrogenase/urease accessory protein HupE